MFGPLKQMGQDPQGILAQILGAPQMPGQATGMLPTMGPTMTPTVPTQPTNTLAPKGNGPLDKILARGK
jgi:hypothetical protein